MSRKDTILIAVVINAGLLAILFITAVIYDRESAETISDLSLPLAEGRPLPSPESAFSSAYTQSPAPQEKNVEKKSEGALQFYALPTEGVEVIASISQEVLLPSEDSSLPQRTVKKQEEIKHQNLFQDESSSAFSPQDFAKVTVKKGDVLEKIAKAHKTSVSAIKKANNLENEKLSVGQVLKIPQNSPESTNNTSKISQIASKTPTTSSEPKVEPALKNQEEPLYYVVVSGDNPWKIARQFGVKYDEILKLNNLDEEKAKNLKIGDKIRVK